MHIRLARSRSESGSTLLIVLGIASLMGIAAISYLMLVSSQHRLAAQSQSWNIGLALAEAGIEDGLAQINVNFGTNYQGSALTNWGLGGNVYGPKTQMLSNGTYSAIIVTTNGPSPTIIATGYTAVTFDLQPIRRVVQAETTNMPAFLVAMAAKLSITTKGNDLTVDSYDSSDPNHSTNGLYDASTRLATGDVASMGGLISIQNASIYGKLMTGPGASYSIGNGSVGDLNWNVKGQIEPDWYKNDFNMDFKDIRPPYTSGLSVDPMTTGTNTYVLGSGDYYVGSDFSTAGKDSLYVSGNARLYVTGNVDLKGAVVIAPGASIKIFVGTESGSAVGAKLANVNTAGNASSFQYYGLPSNTSITWNGNDTYMGIVYAPEADFEAGGGGSGSMDFQGSCTVNSVSLNGHFNFHYDQNLKRSGPAVGYTVTSWREL